MPCRADSDAVLESALFLTRFLKEPHQMIDSAASTGRRNAARAIVEQNPACASSSSCWDAGRQTKILRRLGVSPGPVTLVGPLIPNVVR